MRILVISQYFYPEQFRINEIAVELVKKGHSVTVLTGLPNYPDGEIYKGYEKSYENPSNYKGVTVIRCKIRPRHSGIINLLLNYWSFVKSATKKLFKSSLRFDVVFVYGLSPIVQAIPAIRYRKKYKVPVYYYCLDIWPESVLSSERGKKKISKKHPFYFIAKIISKYIYKRVDKIGIKCEEFGSYLASMFKINKTRIELLYEHAEAIYLTVKEVPFQNDCIDFMFLGNIGSKQNCNQIVDAFCRIKSDKKIKLHFVGSGSELNALKEQAERLNLTKKIVFHKPCSVEETVKYYDFADVCLLTLSNKTKVGLTIPSKLTGYMAAARPIIAAIDGESKAIINNSGCGYVCEPDNVDALSFLFQSVVEKHGCDSYLSAAGINGRQFFLEHFTLERFIINLESSLALLKDNSFVR